MGVSARRASEAPHQPLPMMEVNPRPPPDEKDVPTRCHRALKGSPSACVGEARVVPPTILRSALPPAARGTQPVLCTPKHSSVFVRWTEWYPGQHIKIVSEASLVMTTRTAAVQHPVIRMRSYTKILSAPRHLSLLNKRSTSFRDATATGHGDSPGYGISGAPRKVASTPKSFRKLSCCWPVPMTCEKLHGIAVLTGNVIVASTKLSSSNKHARNVVSAACAGQLVRMTVKLYALRLKILC